MEIRPLRAEDDRSSFRSGDPDLDRFFARFAGQNQFRHHIGATYIAIEANRVLGYATVAPGHAECEALPPVVRRGLPRYPLPVLRLARLAVAEEAQGRGVGHALLRQVFLLAARMAMDYGCIGIVVDAKPGAIDFYSNFGFSPLELAEGGLESRPAPLPMFLPLDLVTESLR